MGNQQVLFSTTSKKGLLALLISGLLLSSGMVPANAAVQDNPDDITIVNDDMIMVPGVEPIQPYEPNINGRGQNIQQAAVTETVYVSVASATQTTADDTNVITLATAQAAVEQMNAYWSAESNGAVNIVFGGYETRQLGLNTCTPNAAFSADTDAAFDGMFAYGSWQGSNNHLIVLTTEHCIGAGFATVGGDGGQIFSSNGVNNGLGVEVLLHEFGHNLGFAHADSSICASTTNYDNVEANLNVNSTVCPTAEYNDYLDIMGYTVNSARPHLSSLQKIRMGWLTEYTTVTSTDRAVQVNVKSLNASEGNRAIKVVNPNTGENYYIEYRTFEGTDATSVEFSGNQQCGFAVQGYTTCQQNSNKTTGTVRVLREMPNSYSTGSTVLATELTPNTNATTRHTHLSAENTFTSFDNSFIVTVNSMNPTDGAIITVAFPAELDATTTTLSLNKTSKVSTAPDTITATAQVSLVNEVYPTGNFVFYDGSTKIATIPADENGTAVYTFADVLTVGNHSITSKFVPDSIFTLSSISTAQMLTITAPPVIISDTTTSLTLSPSSQIYGNPASVTATAKVLTTNGTKPVGSFVFYDGTTVLTTIAVPTTGVATYKIPSTTTVGVHNLKVVYVPTSGANFKTSTSTITPLNVTQIEPIVTVNVSATSQTYMTTTPSTIIGQVASVNGGYPAGTFMFYDGVTKIATVVSNASGSAGYKLSPALAAGTHTFKVTFVPTNTVTTKTVTSAVKTFVVNKIAPAVTATLSSAITTYANTTPVNITAQVAQVNGAWPAGSFVFYDGATSLATVAATTKGNAVYKLSIVTAAGTHNIKTTFVPASTTATNIMNSTSAIKVLTVNQATPVVTTTLTAKQIYGTTIPVVVTAQVAKINGSYPFGSFIFYDGATKLSTAPTNSKGSAAFAISSLMAVGAHSIKVIFVPLSTNVKAVSVVKPFTVTKASTTVSFVTDKTSFARTYVSTLTATIKATGVTKFTGTIKIYSNNVLISTYTLPTNSTGKVAIPLPKFTTVGAKSLYIVYSGNGNITGSTSVKRTVTIT